MQALSMIDMGAKAPEIVAPAKPVEPQGKQFGKVLGEQRQAEKSDSATPKQQTEVNSQAAEQQDVSKKLELVETSAQQPEAEAPVVKQTGEMLAPALTEVVADAEPKLQQIVVNLMKVIAGDKAPEMTEELETTEELLTQMVQQLEGSDLKGEQVHAGIDLSALVEQLQSPKEEGGEQQLAQLATQIEEQLLNQQQTSEQDLVVEESTLVSAELVAAVPVADTLVKDAQATTPKMVENLAQARQILQKAIDAVAGKQTETVESEKQVVATEAEATGELLFGEETAEKLDPRFAGLLKPRGEKPQVQQSLREQVQANNAKMNHAQARQSGDVVVPTAEMNVDSAKVAELSEQFVNNPKQSFEHLVQQTQGQVQSAVTAQTQNVAGKVLPATPVVQLPSGQQVAESQIFDQVVTRFSGSLNGESGRMVLRLQPAELGSLKIELQVEGDRVRANIQAQTQQVQEVLERNLPQLRSALAEQGLKIDQFQVDVNKDQSQQGQYDQLAQQQQQQESQNQPSWQHPAEAEEQIIPLAHLMQNGGGGISLHV